MPVLATVKTQPLCTSTISRKSLRSMGMPRKSAADYEPSRSDNCIGITVYSVLSFISYSDTKITLQSLYMPVIKSFD